MVSRAASRATHDGLAEAVVAELRALSTAMDQLDHAAARHFGLNRTDLRALDSISQAGRISPTELARLVGLSPSATTTAIDRLVAAGYVEREHADGDRRRVVLRPSDRTEQLGADLFGPLIETGLRQAQSYDNAQLRTVLDFLSGHRRAILDHLAGEGRW